MNRCQPIHKNLLQPEPIEPDLVLDWPASDCDAERRGSAFFKPAVTIPFSTAVVGVSGFGDDWTASVPELIRAVSVQFSEKKQLELRANLLEIVLAEFGSRIDKLEATRSIIVPINTFSPEPYELLKPILVSVQAVEDEFEAGWFDANIHTMGENEEEAVSNLKSLILDYFDGFSKEPSEKLGPEPTRQLLVMKQFIQKTM